MEVYHEKGYESVCMEAWWRSLSAGNADGTHFRQQHLLLHSISAGCAGGALGVHMWQKGGAGIISCPSLRQKLKRRRNQNEAVSEVADHRRRIEPCYGADNVSHDGACGIICIVRNYVRIVALKNDMMIASAANQQVTYFGTMPPARLCTWCSR